MEAKLRFFKQDDKWYADVPNHTLEENEMVLGADVFLELVCDGCDEVTMSLTDEEPKQPLLTLHKTQHDDEGAWYDLYGLLYNRILDMNIVAPITEIWICNVTHDVFGEHPEYLYVTDIQCGIV